MCITPSGRLTPSVCDWYGRAWVFELSFTIQRAALFPETDVTKYGLAYCWQKWLLLEADVSALRSQCRRAGEPTYRSAVYL